MEHITKASGKITKFTGWELVSGQTVVSLQVNGRKTKLTAKVFILGLMDVVITVNI